MSFPLSSSITSGGPFSVLGASSVAFPSDANYTVPSGATSGYDALTLIVSGSITATRNLVLPLHQGRPWIVSNTTSQSINAIGATGTGVTIAAGTTQFVFTDATNFYAALTATGGGGGTPTGTGFYHVTSGAMDAAARAVNLGSSDVTGTVALANVGAPTGSGFAKVSGGAWVAGAEAQVSLTADVTGVLPAANQAAQTLTGTSVSGNTGAVVITGLDGTGSTTDFGTSGAKASLPSEILLGGAMPIGLQPVVSTTDGTTLTTLATYTPSSNTCGDWCVSVVGFEFSSGVPTGNLIGWDITFQVVNASGTSTVYNVLANNTRSNGTAPTGAGYSVTVSGGNVLVQVKGGASGLPVKWRAVPSRIPVS